MKTVKSNQSGMAHVAIILAVLVLVVIGVVGWKVMDSKDTKKSTAPANSTKVSAPAAKEQTATEAAKAFVAAIQADNKAEVDSSISTASKAALTQATGKGSYYDVCKVGVPPCVPKLIELTPAKITSAPYKSATGVSGETITFISTSKAGPGTLTLALSMIKENNKYVLDGESEGSAAN